MKIFYTLFLLVFLASCGANTATQVINETTDAPVANVEQDVPAESEDISDSQPDGEGSQVTGDSDEAYIAPANIDLGEEAPIEPANIDFGEEAPITSSDPVSDPSKTPLPVEVIEETVNEIDDAVENISPETSTEETSTSNLIELSTTYTNPALEAVMNIAIEVDGENIIESIAVTSPNYKGMPQFNDGVQSLVGKSLEEASEFYVSGSSLASPAFQKALKKAL